VHKIKVPVVHQDGTPLMPCSPKKARKLLEAGVAEKHWTKTGIFYIQLTTPTVPNRCHSDMTLAPNTTAFA